MGFEWNKMYKWEENYERSIDAGIEEYVCEFYNVEEVLELSQDQIDDIQIFVDEMNEYSVMHGGMYRLLNRWEDEQK